MDINLSEIRTLLERALIGHRIDYLEEVGSTNVYAADLAKKGAPEGTVVIADSQAAGRGRLNREWQSPPGRNLYATIIVRPRIALAESPRLTLAAGIAVAETVLDYCPHGVHLKWPNDVQIRGKKVCGILTEMQGGGGQPDFIVVGIGVNINVKRREFHEDIRDIATSVCDEVGSDIDRTDFIVRLLGKFERWYRIFVAGDFEAIRRRWLQLSDMVGRQVRITSGNKTEFGKVLGINEGGALLYLDETDQVREVLAGDVSVRTEG
jgi:BirA family transcriptional regulator, biotin operon repressor / biotin---[acetyl-CoA-carboxylase] ligase